MVNIAERNRLVGIQHGFGKHVIYVGPEDMAVFIQVDLSSSPPFFPVNGN